MTTTDRTPAQLRAMFGANLRKLSDNHRSISALSRELRINRTQFNRYLNGESFPRPDVLARICKFFEVDARVLLEPVDQISRGEGPIVSTFLTGFMGEAVQHVAEKDFPNGFYQFSRRSFVHQTKFVRGLVHVQRHGNSTYVRGYEPKSALAMQGIPPDPSTREFRGYALRVEDGMVVMVARRNGLTASMNYLTRITSFQNNFWVGYVGRTVSETASSNRMTRLVYEYMGHGVKAALPVARYAGFCAFEDLIPFHQRLLQPDVPLR
ncbi:MAG: helix-turn-helix domain-containing protein [Roseobacter sp.]